MDVTLGNRHRIGLINWSRPIRQNWTSRPGPNIRLASKHGSSTAKETGTKRAHKNRPGVIKPQVITGAPPGTRTPNPRIKSPLLSSILLPELLPSDDSTCRYLPFCAVTRIRGGLRIPRTTGAYRGIRANMEQTSDPRGLDQCRP
jgi:hypothetical protein